MTELAEYGSWHSPISPELLTSARPSYDFLSSSHGNLYWLESRPWENGRSVVVEKTPSGETRDVLPAPLSARSRVHEYGGTPYVVVDDVLYFCLNDDQRIYAINLQQEPSVPTAITPGNHFRYADFCYDARHHQLICVCEDHSQIDGEPENFIATIALDGSGSINRLVSGADFYAYPRISPDTKQLCWLQWNHPLMPWHSTELMLADMPCKDDLKNMTVVAGGPEESIFQPQWSPTGQLFFVSDRSNWWNLYRYDHQQGTALPIVDMSAEFATPLWVLGMSTYGFCNDSLIACYSQNGEWHLAVFDNNHTMLTIETEYTQISSVHCDNKTAWFIGQSTDAEPEIAAYRFGENAPITLHSTTEPVLDRAYISNPQPVHYETDAQQYAHGFYYPPTNPNYHPPKDQRPPLLVICHGGPTGATSTALNMKIQFWTSRGFAVLDVNYRGSTGYGRQYRQALNGQWGVSDVQDVIAGARYLADGGLVDDEKLAIRGSSAGGYTVLAALTFESQFKAGACLYGVGNLETLARDTHKFEARYLDHLVGKYPEQRDLYLERSPIHHTDQLNCPIIFFQGLEDKVVPPDQAESMVNALRKKKLPVAYLPFPGEGHGFRKAETLSQVLQAELYFYSQVFAFNLPDLALRINIENLAHQP